MNRPPRRALVCWMLVSSALTLPAADRGVADTNSSPHAKVRTLGPGEVRWTHGFWADRFDVCRRNTIPSMRALMEGNQYSQFFQNFRIAAGVADGRHCGAPFNDGEVYKWLEAASATLAGAPDPELERHIEEIVGIVAKALRTPTVTFTPRF